MADLFYVQIERIYMFNFILGFFLSPILIVLCIFVYLQFLKRRRVAEIDAAIKSRQTAYRKDEYKDFVGEFPTIPTERNQKNAKKNKV